MNIAQSEKIQLLAESYCRELFAKNWSPTELNYSYSKNNYTDFLSVNIPISNKLIEKIESLSKLKNIEFKKIILAGWVVALMHLSDSQVLTFSIQFEDGNIFPIRIDLDPNSDFSFVINLVSDYLKEIELLSKFSYSELAENEYGITPYGHNLLTPILFNFSTEEASFSPITINIRNIKNNVEIVVQGRDFFASYEHLHQLGISIINILDFGISCNHSLSQLELLEPEALIKALQMGSAEKISFDKDSRIEDIFSARVAEFPSMIAVSHRENKLTYSELDEISHKLAFILRQAGVQSGEIVGIFVPRSIPMIVAILAILKIGAVYMPLDPDYPSERIQFLLKDSQSVLIISDDDTNLQHEIDSDIHSIGFNALKYQFRIQPLQRTAENNIVHCQGAYLMYTSGTTGFPKGVLNTHMSVLRLVLHASYIDLKPGINVAQMGATGFDASVFEIWTALLNGGCLQIVDREVLLDCVELGRFFREKETDIALITTPLFTQLASDDPYLFAPLSQLLIGGDVISAKHVMAVYAACPKITILNAYGPTENGVISTIQRIDRDDTNNASIGAPINNTYVLILNRFGRLMPPLFEGELHVGGDGLAIEYLRRPEDTAKAFIAHPYDIEKRIYRTGDRARWKLNQELEFLGREDFQIKIRGFRVELAEIEKTALTYPGVNEALVLSHKDHHSIEYRLHCYLGTEGEFNVASFREYLADRLPSHMLPSAVCSMLELPLTVNGKIDRNALSAMVEESSNAKKNASNSKKVLLLEICKSILNLNHLTMDDDLTQQGASSLTAAIIASRVWRELGVRLPVSEIIISKTVTDLEKILERHQIQAANSIPILNSESKEFVEATPQQNRLFVEQSKNIDACHYNLPVLIELSKEIDLQQLQDAFAILIKRHEILRTSFERCDDETRQVIHSDFPLMIQEAPAALDVLSALSLFISPFDLQQAPLWRVGIYRGTNKSYLLFDIHHILTDGYSLVRLFSEWESIYLRKKLSEPQLQYQHYSNWLASKNGQTYLAKQEYFWLSMHENKPPLPDLPTDYPRSRVRSLNGKFYTFDFGEERSALIQDFSYRKKVSVYQFLLACYSIFLAQITGSDDVTVGTPVLGRLIPGADEIQGMFVNTLCLRLNPLSKSYFDEYLFSVSSITQNAFDNQDYPFDRLVEHIAPLRSYGRAPLFDAMFALQNTGLSKQTFLGGSISWVPEASKTSIYDLNLQIEERVNDLHANWHFNSDLFITETIVSFCERLFFIIDQVITDVNFHIEELNFDKNFKPMALPEIEFDF